MRLSAVFDCERMKYPHTGLYHYCHHLGMALKKKSIDSNIDISYYLPIKEKDSFGKNANIITQKKIHKILFPSIEQHQIWHSTFQGTRYFPFNKKIKKILTVHDLNFLYDENKSAEKMKKKLHQLQLKINQADAIIAISNFVLYDLKKHLNIDDRLVNVIYNGSNFNTLSKECKPQKTPDAPYLYTIGTITNKKNFHVLPALLRSFDGLLIISGIIQNQEYHAKIVAEAKKYGVENRLVFTGPVSEAEKKWYMQHCEAFLFPSLAEGFGLPVVEAMYLGKPVILSTRTSLPEIGGDVAYYFENFEPEHMQKVLENCMSCSDTFSRAKLLEERAKTFNWDRSAQEHLELYSRIINI